MTPQNDSPTISVNTGATVGERLSVTITSSMLNSIDPDDNAPGLTYTASNYSNGWIEVNGNIQSTFTQADINNNRVVFQHDSSETTTASFDISLADGGEHGATSDTDTFTLTVTPRNDAPVITVNTGATIAEGSNLTIINTMLAATDDASPANSLTWTISQLTGGHFENNISGLVTTSFTQADINAGIIDFIHHGSEASQASFSGVVADDGADGVDPVAFTFTLDVTPVNDDPTAITLNRTTIPENMAIGDTVGILHTTDADLPGDTFTYTLMDNPNNLFSVNGNKLVMAQPANFDLLPSDTITIRTNDGNGGIFDQTFTITFTEVKNPDTTQQFFIPLRTDAAGNILRFHSPDRHTETQKIQRLEAGNAPSQDNRAGHIIHDIQPILNNNIFDQHFLTPIQNNVLAFESILGETINNNITPHILDNIIEQTTSGTSETPPHEVLTLEDALDFFTRLDTIQDYIAAHDDAFPADQSTETVEKPEDPNTSQIKRLSIDDQFKDIISYQLNRQNVLKAALQNMQNNP